MTAVGDQRSEISKYEEIKFMNKKICLLALCAMLFALCFSAEAQQPAKVPRTGLLRPGSPPDAFVEAFRQGLRDLGYVEGTNIVVEYRWAEGKNERLPDLAADLVRLGVNVIVPGGNPATRAAQKACPGAYPDEVA